MKNYLDNVTVNPAAILVLTVVALIIMATVVGLCYLCFCRRPSGQTQNVSIALDDLREGGEGTVARNGLHGKSSVSHTPVEEKVFLPETFARRKSFKLTSLTLAVTNLTGGQSGLRM